MFERTEGVCMFKYEYTSKLFPPNSWLKVIGASTSVQNSSSDFFLMDKLCGPQGEKQTINFLYINVMQRLSGSSKIEWSFHKTVKIEVRNHTAKM